MDPDEIEGDVLIDEQGEEAPIIDDEGEEEAEISFGDEPEEEDDTPDLPKHLRSQIKERDRKLILAERELEELRKKTAPAPVVVGPRPRIEAYNYDDEDPDYLEAVEAHEAAIAAAAVQKQTADADDGLVEEAQLDVAKFQQSVAALTYPDAQAIVKSVGEAMPAAMQYAVAATANDPATFIYALGKHPAKLQELLGIKNSTKQIAAIVRMEASLKVGQGRKPPEPDRPSKGNASAATKTDKELARLEKEADRTGDRTELIKYRKKIAA